MTIAFHKGRYSVRLAVSDADLAACQALRHRCFFRAAGVDADRFDARCTHVMIAGERGLVSTFRLLLIPDGMDLSRTYTAQSYDLSALAAYPGAKLELGRFCIDPSVMDGDVLRVAWGALTQLVDANDVRLLFGCSSFDGIDPAPYVAAFGVLAARHQPPAPWWIGRKAEAVLPLEKAVQRGGAQQMPPLLRTYLMMGGWVSDHAVIDRVMQTLHVFTALEIAKIPAGRAAALRAIADASGGDI